jgi:hypothetical protein
VFMCAVLLLKQLISKLGSASFFDFLFCFLSYL